MEAMGEHEHITRSKLTPDMSQLKRNYQIARKCLQDASTQNENVKVPCTVVSFLVSIPLLNIDTADKEVLETLKSANEAAALISKHIGSMAEGKSSETSSHEVDVCRPELMKVMKSVALQLSMLLKKDRPGTTIGPDCTSDKRTEAATSVPVRKQMSVESASGMRCATVAPMASLHFKPTILVIGAGATGACTAFKTRQILGSGAIIEVWEKARGAGGRMTTNRQEIGAVSLRADLGAPYLSLDGSNPDCTEVADMLIQDKICSEITRECLSGTPERPSRTTWRHLAGVDGGVNDALKHLLDKADAKMLYQKRVASLDEHHGRWRAKPYSGPPQDFDAVVLAVPGCGPGGDNLNKIHGGWEGWISAAQDQQLTSVQHDQRWAFAFFLPMDCSAKIDEFFGPTAVERTIKDTAIHLLCYQSRKTFQASGCRPKGGLAIVAHTTVEWARRNSRANGHDQRLLNEIADSVKRAIGFSAPLMRIMLASKVITWKQCHVTKPIPEQHPHGPCMLVSSTPPLLLAGDYFSESNFGGCLRSGFAAADTLASALSSAESPARQECRVREEKSVGSKRKQADGRWKGSSWDTGFVDHERSGKERKTTWRGRGYASRPFSGA